MKKLLRSLILGMAIFLSHIVLGFLYVWITDSQYEGYYGLLGGLIFYLVFGYWVYWLISYIYIYVTKHDNYRKTRYSKAVVIVLLGYFISRVPDIIDGHFFKHFEWQGFLVFFIFPPLLVEIDMFIRKIKLHRSV